MSYRIAAFFLGLIVGAYWFRVLRMARKARQKTGRAANFLPAETVGRVLRIVWVPVVVVWIVQPFVTAITFPRHGPMTSLVSSPWLAWPMVVLAAGCFWLSRICWRAMGKSWRMGIDPAERTTLVLSGPYQFVRHPIYALSQLMMVCTVAAVPTPMMIAAGVLHLALMQWEARREESYLRQVQGEQYASYCRAVGRFIPFKRKWRAAPVEVHVHSPGAE